MDQVLLIFEPGSFVFPIYITLKIIFILLDIALFILFVYAFLQSLKSQKHHSAHNASHGHGRDHAHVSEKILTLQDQLTKERWASIVKKTANGSSDTLKLAIIEADKLADTILKQFGLTGDHMGDRLEQIEPDELRTLEKLWRAHRLRNHLVHTPGFQLTPEEAKKALSDYQAFLEEVKAL